MSNKELIEETKPVVERVVNTIAAMLIAVLLVCFGSMLLGFGWTWVVYWWRGGVMAAKYVLGI